MINQSNQQGDKQQHADGDEVHKHAHTNTQLDTNKLFLLQ